MKRILFVCTGNTCRSPMAEALLKAKRADLEVKSAGLFAMVGAPASDQAVTVLAEQGITLDHHARLLDQELIEWAELILTMTQDHKQLVLAHFPNSRGKVFTLGEYGSSNQSIYNELAALNEELKAMQAKLLASEVAGGAETEEILDWMTTKKEEIVALEQQLHQTNVSDPFGGPVAVYREIYLEIEAHIDGILAKLDEA